MTEVFLDPYDIWNPKWSPLDFNSFKWIVKPSKLSPKDGEFKVAVDVAGFTGTDDKLNVEVLTENDKQLLSIQGEHVEDDGQCYTRKNLLKLYRIDGQCVATSLCVFVADDILVASLMVLDGNNRQSDLKQAPLFRSMVKSESQTELKKHSRMKPANKSPERYHVSTVSTDIPAERPQRQAQVTSEQFQTLEHQPDKHVSDYTIQQNVARSGDAHESLESIKSGGNEIKTSKPSIHFQVTANDTSQTIQQGHETGVAVESFHKLTPEQFRKVFGSDQYEQPAVRTAKSDDFTHKATFETMKTGGVVNTQTSSVHFQPVTPQPRQDTSVTPNQKPAVIASKRATGDIMKLMNRFTGQQTTSQPTVQKRTSQPNIQKSIGQSMVQQSSGQFVRPQGPIQPTEQHSPSHSFAQEKLSQSIGQQVTGQTAVQQSPQQKSGQQIPNQLAQKQMSTESVVLQSPGGQLAGQQAKPPSLQPRRSIAAEPAFKSAEYPGTCVVHRARRASVMAPLQPTVDEFIPQAESTEKVDDFMTEHIDSTVKIPPPETTRETLEESGGASKEAHEETSENVKQAVAGSFSHPYEEVEECELEQKFKDVTFASAVNANVGEQGQDVLRVTLDLSDFRSDQLAMFIVGDDIVVNVEILRLIGNSKTLTKRYTLPDNADKANVHSLLTSEGILQIDVPLLKPGSSETKPEYKVPTEVIASTEF